MGMTHSTTCTSDIPSITNDNDDFSCRLIVIDPLWFPKTTTRIVAVIVAINYLHAHFMTNARYK